MIGSLAGILQNQTGEVALIDVGGVGYEVFISARTANSLPDLGGPVTLHIHTNVTESQIALYGFLSPAEKGLFRKLLTVSGIGPKLGLQILSGLKPDDLVAAIGQQDVARLTAINGIGKKTAERLIVELKDKLLKPDDLASIGLIRTESTPHEKIIAETLSALINLGYNRNLAEQALAGFNSAGIKSVEDLLRQALKILSTV